MTLKGQIQISVEMFCFACKIQSCFVSFHFVFFVLPENYVFCSSHNWSKISSNQADSLQTHRGVKGVSGDA